jgi:hypothetical protein
VESRASPPGWRGEAPVPPLKFFDTNFRGSLRHRGSAAPVWHSDNQGSPARQFVIGDFRQELQVEAESPALLTGRVVEKVHDVSPKSILGSAAFIEIERAHRIHFDLRMFAQGSAQVTLESKRSLPHLRHGERNNAIRHS